MTSVEPTTMDSVSPEITTIMPNISNITYSDGTTNNDVSVNTRDLRDKLFYCPGPECPVPKVFLIVPIPNVPSRKFFQ